MSTSSHAPAATALSSSLCPSPGCGGRLTKPTETSGCDHCGAYPGPVWGLAERMMPGSSARFVLQSHQYGGPPMRSSCTEPSFSAKLLRSRDSFLLSSFLCSPSDLGTQSRKTAVLDMSSDGTACVTLSERSNAGAKSCAHLLRNAPHDCSTPFLRRAQFVRAQCIRAKVKRGQERRRRVELYPP